MNYQESVDFMTHASLYGSKKNGLEGIRALLDRLGNPQEQLRFVHVAGTNGKGSVCSYLDSILRCAGYKTGLYTSPYLERFTERIRVNGQEASQEDVAECATRVRQAADAMVAEGMDHPTFFELVTATAMLIYQKYQVDLVVLETGLGGRLDATNVVIPEVSVIMAIGLDHTNVLGDTIEAIAGEKAGIMKEDVPVVVYPQPFIEAHAALMHHAREKHCPFYDVSQAQIRLKQFSLTGQTFSFACQGMDLGEFEVSLLGSYQMLNASTAIMTAMVLGQKEEFNIPLSAIREGLAKTRWAGRLEVVNQDPIVILDGAHNPQGAEELTRCLRNFFPAADCVLVTGIMHTKDSLGVSLQLAPYVRDVVVTEPQWTKALPAEEYAQDYMNRVRGEVIVEKDQIAALERGLALARAKNAPMIVAGSLYLAGAARTWAREKGWIL